MSIVMTRSSSRSKGVDVAGVAVQKGSSREQAGAGAEIGAGEE